jgi:hypothetical protein
MNYYLHNYCDYDCKKFNLRHLVIRFIKDHYIHLRDFSIDYLFQNPNYIYIPIKPLESDLQDVQKTIKERKAELKNLTEEDLKKEYQIKEVEVHNSYMVLENCYEKDYADKIVKCLDTVKPILNKFKDLCDVKYLNDHIDEIISTAEYDSEQWYNDNQKSVERAHNHVLKSYEQFKKEFIQQKEDFIEHLQDRVKSIKKNIKLAQQQNDAIRLIMDALENCEKEMELNVQS